MYVDATLYRSYLSPLRWLSVVIFYIRCGIRQRGYPCHRHQVAHSGPSTHHAAVDNRHQRTTQLLITFLAAAIKWPTAVNEPRSRCTDHLAGYIGPHWTTRKCGHSTTNYLFVSCLLLYAFWFITFRITNSLTFAFIKIITHNLVRMLIHYKHACIYALKNSEIFEK